MFACVCIYNMHSAYVKGWCKCPIAVWSAQSLYQPDHYVWACMLIVCSYSFKVPGASYWKGVSETSHSFTSVSKHVQRPGWLEESTRLHPQLHLLRQSCSEGLGGFVWLHCCLEEQWHVFHSVFLNIELSYFSREGMQMN